MIKKDLITKLIDERIAELNNGLYVVELTISPSNVIRVELDKVSGGVTVTDCMSVSRNVEHNLDREEQDFELHVSSAGLDKSLRHIKQYIKNIGRKLRVESMEVSTLEGTLTAADNQAFTLEWKQREAKPVGKGKVTVTKQKTLSYDQISIAKVLVK